MKTINTEVEKKFVPFLKWAGGKRKIIDRIKAMLPDGKRLIEPFSGSATVFLNTSYKENLIADTNNDVINLFNHLKKEKKPFVEYCSGFFIPENNDPDRYYQFRKDFNETIDIKLRAALFLYLNKHGYNGLCRYNSSGGFNVPFGKYKSVRFPEDYIYEFIEQSTDATFITQDFEKTFSDARPGDVIYCDPPYVLQNDSNRTFKYHKDDFGLDKQEKLAELAILTAKKGIPVLVSNHLTDFTKEIYKEAELSTFNVRRTISCKGDKRKEASELLALFS